MKKLKNILEYKKSKELIKFFNELGFNKLYSKNQFDFMVIYIMNHIFQKGRK